MVENVVRSTAWTVGLVKPQQLLGNGSNEGRNFLQPWDWHLPPASDTHPGETLPSPQARTPHQQPRLSETAEFVCLLAAQTAASCVGSSFLPPRSPSGGSTHGSVSAW